MAKKIRQLRRPRRQKVRFADPVVVSIPEFARLSGLGEHFTRQLVKDGTLPCRRIRNRVWIVRAPAIQWISGQAEPRPAA